MRAWRSRQCSGRSGGPLTPVGGLMVIAVTNVGDGDVSWQFSGGVTVGAGACAELEVFDGDAVAYKSPVGVAQGAFDEVIATYDAGFGGDAPWRILGQPTCIAQGIATPQSGVMP